MPIKGLTDRVTPRFPNLGKLRKGGLKEKRIVNGREVMIYGSELNHFRFTSERPEVQKAFTDAYGEKPVAIPCYLPYRTVEDNFSTWKEKWLAGGLIHRCDGETMNLWLDQATGKYRTDPQPCPGGCDEVGRLVLILPELIKAGHVGYVTMETHSLNDIMSIQASLMAVAETRTNNELGLRGVGFVLRRVQETISTPDPHDKSKRIRRQKWLVKLEPEVRWVRLQLTMAEKHLALPDGSPDGAPDGAPSGERVETGAESEAPEETEFAGAENDDAADFADAEFTEADDTEPEQPAESRPEPEEEKPERNPDDLLARRFEMREHAPKRLPKGMTMMTAITEKQKQLLALLINEIGGKQNGAADQDRHLLMEFLWGKQRLGELTFGEALETLDWLIDKEQSEPGKYTVKVESADEAKRMIAAQLKTQGQTELPM